MQSVFEKPRQWQRLVDKHKIIEVIRDRVKMRPFFVKESSPPAEFLPESIDSERILFHHPVNYEVGRTVTLYTTLGRQLEIDMELESIVEPGSCYLIPVEARVGKVKRDKDRMENDRDAVYAANFQMSKRESDLAGSSAIASRIIFSEFERNLSTRFPGIQILDGSGRDVPADVKVAGATKKIVFEPNLLSPESDPQYANLILELKDEGKLKEEHLRWRNRGIQSIIVIPLLYDTDESLKSVIGFIRLETRQPRKLTETDLENLKAECSGIIQRIAEANTFRVTERQKILNFTDQGAALLISNDELIEYIPEKNRLTFDLIFKKQAPVRLQAHVCHIHRILKDRLVVGLEFDGSAWYGQKFNPLDRLRELVQLYRTKRL